MKITRRYIQDLREKSFIDISEDTEKLILEKFGEHLEADMSIQNKISGSR